MCLTVLASMKLCMQYNDLICHMGVSLCLCVCVCVCAQKSTQWCEVKCTCLCGRCLHPREEAAEGGASSGDEAMGNASSSSQRTVAKKQGTKQKRGGKGSRRTQEEVEEENQEEQEIIRRFNMDTYDEDSDEEDSFVCIGNLGPVACVFVCTDACRARGNSIMCVA